MLFGNNRRVEEDLERIRRANLPPEAVKQQDEQKEKDETERKKTLDGWSFRDTMAMIVAALSLVLPYALAIMGAVALFGFLLMRVFFGV